MNTEISLELEVEEVELSEEVDLLLSCCGCSDEMESRSKF